MTRTYFVSHGIDQLESAIVTFHIGNVDGDSILNVRLLVQIGRSSRIVVGNVI